MRYIVLGQLSAANRGAVSQHTADKADALRKADEMLRRGMVKVKIVDQDGRELSGHALLVELSAT